MAKELDSIVKEFISMNKLYGTLTNEQYNNYIKYMDENTNYLYSVKYVHYKYQYNDLTFNVWDNKFSIRREE